MGHDSDNSQGFGDGEETDGGNWVSKSIPDHLMASRFSSEGLPVHCGGSGDMCLGGYGSYAPGRSNVGSA
jgi:hypothetical protein